MEPIAHLPIGPYGHGWESRLGGCDPSPKSTFDRKTGRSPAIRHGCKHPPAADAGLPEHLSGAEPCSLLSSCRAILKPPVRRIVPLPPRRIRLLTATPAAN